MSGVCLLYKSICLSGTNTLHCVRSTFILDFSDIPGPHSTLLFVSSYVPSTILGPPSTPVFPPSFLLVLLHMPSPGLWILIAISSCPSSFFSSSYLRANIPFVVALPCLAVCIRDDQLMHVTFDTQVIGDVLHDVLKLIIKIKIKTSKFSSTWTLSSITFASSTYKGNIWATSHLLYQTDPMLHGYRQQATWCSNVSVLCGRVWWLLEVFFKHTIVLF